MHYVEPVTGIANMAASWNVKELTVLHLRYDEKKCMPRPGTEGKVCIRLLMAINQPDTAYWAPMRDLVDVVAKLMAAEQTPALFFTAAPYMLEETVKQLREAFGKRMRLAPPRNVAPDMVMVHQERCEDDMPFKDELHRRARVSKGRTKLIKLISGKEVAGEKEGGGDESERIEKYSGRVEKDFLGEHVADVASRVVYLCGPVGFMESVKSMLSSVNVPADEVITEEFNF